MADAYAEIQWFDGDLRHVLSKTWQGVCHGEKMRDHGAYLTVKVAGLPIAMARDSRGKLRAYHAWIYRLDGQVARVPHAENLHDFDKGENCLDQVQIEVSCDAVFVYPDLNAGPTSCQSDDLETEVRHRVPGMDKLGLGHRHPQNCR